MRVKILLTALTAFFACSGCAIPGLIASPTASENKIPAEFDISARAEDTILILVSQSPWGDIPSDMRPLLTEDIAKLLMKRAKFRSDRLVSYRKLARFRSQRTDFYLLSPVDVAAALGAKIVLLVDVQDYELYELPISGYHKGSVSIRSLLLDVPTGLKLWPDSEDAREVKVAFEAEGGGIQALAEKLAKTAAYCIVRYFYNCPSNDFKIWGEQPRLEWQQW